MNNSRLDRVLGALMRLSFIAIITVMCINVSDAFATDEPQYGYRMVTVGISTVSGILESVGTAYSDDYGSCMYNMGVIGQTFYEAGYIGAIMSPFTRNGTTAMLSFWANPEHTGGELFLIVMRCEASTITI